MENINPITKCQEHPCFWVQYHETHANIYRVYGGIYKTVFAADLKGLVEAVKVAIHHNYKPYPIKAPVTSSCGGTSERVAKGMESEDPPGLYPPTDM